MTVYLGSMNLSFKIFFIICYPIVSLQDGRKRRSFHSYHPKAVVVFMIQPGSKMDRFVIICCLCIYNVGIADIDPFFGV